MRSYNKKLVPQNVKVLRLHLFGSKDGGGECAKREIKSTRPKQIRSSNSNFCLGQIRGIGHLWKDDAGV